MLAVVRHVASLAWSFTYVLWVNVPFGARDCFLEAQNQTHIIRMPQRGSSSLHPSFARKCVPKTIWWPCLGRNINYSWDKAPIPVTVSQVQPRVSERSDEVGVSPFVCTTAMGDYTQRTLCFVRLILSSVRPFVFVWEDRAPGVAECCTFLLIEPKKMESKLTAAEKSFLF